VVHADALFGSPDVIAIVAGADIAAMDAVIDRIADVPEITGTIRRWLAGSTAWNSPSRRHDRSLTLLRCIAP
jgi:hypothetical protein